MENMTNEQLVVTGGVFGAALGVYLTFAIIFWILLIIAEWKILVKAGEKGWKSLIPIYNVYMFYKIAKVNFWVWCFIPALLVSIFSSVGGDEPSTIIAILMLASIVYFIVGICKWCIGLSKNFGHGAGFAVGLFFLPNIFQLILGFGSSKYVK